MSWQRNIVIKTEKDIALMREAGRINALALQAVRDLIRPGITTRELDAVAAEVIQKHNAISAFKNYPGPYPYPATITVCINDELVHGIPGNQKLVSGDIVSVDCGTVFEEYIGDSAFTVGVGELSENVYRLLDVTERSLYAGISALVVGNRIGDVSAAIQTIVESHGYNVPREYTGHGVGHLMHEGPQVPNYGTPGRGLALQPGMTIALEPMVLMGSYHTRVKADQWTVCSKDGALTAHFEHTVAVTNNGPMILTDL